MTPYTTRFGIQSVTGSIAPELLGATLIRECVSYYVPTTNLASHDIGADAQLTRHSGRGNCCLVSVG